MKKRLAALGAALTMALAFTGCGGSDGDGGGGEGGKSTVTVWMYPVIADQAASQKFWEQTEKDFEAANSNVDLKIELQPWDGRDEKIATAIASGKGPDFVVLGPDQVPQYQKTGGLKSVKDGIGDQGRFLESAIKAASFESDIYAVPIYHTITTTVYNKKVFADAGVQKLPTTWDEVKEAAPKLAAKGVSIMDYSGSPENTLNLSFYPLLWQAGGSVFAEDGKKVAFNSDQGKSTLQFLVDLQKVKGLPADAATKNNKVEGSGLANGKVAMTYAAVKPDAALMSKALGAENVEVGAPLTGEKQVAFGLPGLLARTSISKNDDAANAVAKFFGSDDFQTKLAKEAGYFPALKDVKLDANDPLNEPFQKALEFAKSGEVHPQARQVMAALAPQIQAALQGKKSVEQALADAEKECNALIEG